MQTYRVAICDDNPADIQYLQSLLRRYGAERDVSFREDTFPSSEAFLFHYADNMDYDLLLLDIEMADMDGVTLAKKIRRDNEALQIIFITGYSDYISDGYDVAALHYLIKPVHAEKLFQVLDRAGKRLQKNERSLTLELSGETVRIPLNEIRYLDVERNYVTIHAKTDVTIKKTLGEFEPKLDDRFFRIGRSCILNLTYIQRVTKTDVYLSEGSVLPLPRGLYEPLNRAIIAYH